MRGDKFNYQGWQGEIGMEMGGGEARAGGGERQGRGGGDVGSINNPSEAGSSSS